MSFRFFASEFRVLKTNLSCLFDSGSESCEDIMQLILVYTLLASVNIQLKYDVQFNALICGYNR